MKRWWLLACVLVIAPIPLQAADAPIPPGMESDVRQLVAGDALPGAHHVGRTRIRAQAIEIELIGPSGKALVELRRSDSAAVGAPLGRSKSFSAWLVSGPDGAEVVTAGRALAAQIAERDTGDFFDKAAVLLAERRAESGENQGDRGWVEACRLGLLDDVRRALTWAALLVLLAWAAVRRVRAGVSAKDALWGAALLGLVVLAAWMRWVLPPWAPLHANTHGIAELRGLAGFPGEIETDRYGVAWRQIVRAVLQPFEGGAHAALAFSAIAGALSAGVLALLSGRWAGRRPGLAAGLALAVLPAHVVLSPSESPMALAGLLLLVAFAALVRDSLLSPWIAALALACACELGVTTLAFPLAALAFVLLARTIDPRRFLLPALPLALAMVLHLWSLWPVLGTAQAERGDSLAGLGALSGPNNLLWQDALAPRSLLGVALIALLLLALRSLRESLGLLIASLIVIVPGYAVAACRTDTIRYQTVGLLLVIVAATSIARASYEPRMRSLSALALVLLLVLPALRGLHAEREVPLDAAAYRFVRAAADSTTGPLTVWTPPRRMGEVLTDFPDFLFGPGKRVRVAAAEDTTEPGDGCAVYLAPSCYAFTEEELAAGALGTALQVDHEPVRPECRSLLRLVDWEAPAPFAARVEVPSREAEFFRVPAERPRVGLLPCAEGLTQEVHTEGR